MHGDKTIYNSAILLFSLECIKECLMARLYLSMGNLKYSNSDKLHTADYTKSVK
jgi:hypothetical protein